MDPLQFFRRRSRRAEAQGHMTWASGSISRSLSLTGSFLRRQLWVWPIIAVVLLSVIGFAARRAIESTMRENLASQLKTLLTIESAMLETWLEIHSANAESLANSSQLRECVYALIDAEDVEHPEGEQIQDEEDFRRQVDRLLAPELSSHDYEGYFIVDGDKRIIASSYPALIGQQEVVEYDDFLTSALDGETVVCPPFASVVMMKTQGGRMRTGEPTMYVCAPLRDRDYQAVGALALQIQPEAEFTKILQFGRIGETGETYAFNRQGQMISESRFDEDLILLGLLPDQEDSRSILNVLIRDPQGDMTAGYRPGIRRSQMQPTRMMADAVAGNSGVDVKGYRDYRGVPVVGAWSWLSRYEMGVATEADYAEAFRPLTILQRTFWALYTLLILCSVAILVFTMIVARLRRETQRAVVEAQQLGQYKLEEKLGEGAMGVVYKGHHAMLHRPTAIKLLNVDKVNDALIQRFEREVQITCKLNHPNTIAIYDYGRTPEDVFYYAMEYLDGIDLQQLVDKYGPQPESRVIHILLQICGSLYEAHSEGLVHRDIKPANIMLNRRGCVPDLVKVLDFGLVKTIDEQHQQGQASEGSVAGTPLYMSPEAIQSPLSVDARSDIYAVGAVGYFLLAGRPVFQAKNLVELCRKQVDEVPVPPSKRSEINVSAELESALLTSLSKSRARRPQTARDLALLLEKCPAAGKWSVEDGDAWWGRHERGELGQSTSGEANNTATLDRTLDIEDA